MTIINTSPDRAIQLGYEGEDRVTVLRFRYGADWLENGEGIFHIRVRRHGEHTAYNAQLVTEDPEYNCLLMTVTNVELSVKGAGEMQVVYSGVDFVKKSPIYSYNVSRAVDEAVDPPVQDVYTQIIESLSDLQTDVQGVADAVDGIGNLADLTTTAKTDLVSAINEVNAKGGGGGGSVTVDDALSTTSQNPVQNKVIASALNDIEGAFDETWDAFTEKADIRDVEAVSRVVSRTNEALSDLQTTVQSKADIQTVSALSDAVNGLDGDIQSLQTGKADTSTVTALSGTVSSLQTTVQSKADAQTVTTLSGTVTGLQTSKADKSYVDTQLSTKASAQTVSDLSGNVSDLQTGLAGKVGDVQINGASVVADGVANVPLGYGLKMVSNSLTTDRANFAMIKSGGNVYNPIVPDNQHHSVFYGLAKIAGRDEWNSNLPVGQYTDKAKIAIQKMLGIYEAPWELIKEETFTNAEEADYIITVDSDGNAFELTDALMLFELPTDSEPASKGYYGQIWFEYGTGKRINPEPGGVNRAAGGASVGAWYKVTSENGLVFCESTTFASSTNSAPWRSRYIQYTDYTANGTMGMFIGTDFAIIKINIKAVTGTGHYKLYGKRKWT